VRAAHDVRAGLGERQRDAAADAAPGAGDERDPVGERKRSRITRALPQQRRRGAPRDERQVEIRLDAGLRAHDVGDRADAVDRRRDDARIALEALRDRLGVSPWNVSDTEDRR
jgi:hypothetical protein